MKRFFSLLLGLLLCAGCAAMAETEQVYTAIPLGGTLGDYVLSGEQFGSYTKIENPAANWLYDNCTTELYFDENAAVCYIAVYHWDNAESISLDAFLRSELVVANAIQGGYKRDIVLGEVRDIYGFDKATNTYFQCLIAMDGFSVVELEFHYACDEIELDEGLYAYVPKGYTNLISEKTEDDYALLTYDNDELPTIWFGAYTAYDYDTSAQSWADLWETFPVSREQYALWTENGWTTEGRRQYYHELGGELLADCKIAVDPLPTPITWYAVRNTWYPKHEGDVDITEIMIMETENWTCEIWVTDNRIDAPYFGYALALSLHAK